MEEVVAGGGCGQVKGIGNLRYSERLARVAIADCMSLVYRDFTPSAIYAFFPATAQQESALQPVLTGRHQSFRQRALDKTWHHGHANPSAPPDPPLRRHPTSAPPPCPADAIVPVPTQMSEVEAMKV